MRQVWTGLVAAAALAIAGCNGAADRAAVPAEPTAEDRQAVEQLQRQYEEGWAAGDAAAAARIYADDGAHRGPDGQLGTGRAEVERLLEEAFAGPFQGSRITLRQEELRFPAADVAVGRGSYQIAGGPQPEGQTGYYLFVATRRNGEWRTLESQSYVPMQPPPQAPETP